jgi:NAD-dependent dihydropyrimidine dehydrogenase PreA subunit
MEQITKFAGQIYEKLQTQDATAPVAVPGARPYRPYYQPRDRQGNPASIVKVVPKTNDNCIQCGLCATLCPMGSIDPDELSSITGICIKCCACIKYCPVEAKYFDDENYLWHKQELEIAFSDVRREPEYFF